MTFDVVQEKKSFQSANQAYLSFSGVANHCPSLGSAAGRSILEVRSSSLNPPSSALFSFSSQLCTDAPGVLDTPGMVGSIEYVSYSEY